MEEKEIKFNLFTDENKNVCITSDIEEFEDYVTVEEEYYILMHIISDLAKKAVNADLYNKDIKNLSHDDKLNMELSNVTDTRDVIIKSIINEFYNEYNRKVKLPQQVYEFVMGIYFPIAQTSCTKYNAILNTTYSDDIKFNELTQLSTALFIDLANFLIDSNLEKSRIIDIIKEELEIVYNTVEETIKDK